MFEADFHYISLKFNLCCENRSENQGMRKK